jgi:hypothetical protein
MTSAMRAQRRQAHQPWGDRSNSVAIPNNSSATPLSQTLVHRCTRQSARRGQWCRTPLRGTDLECEREITGGRTTGIRTADAADLLVRRALTCAFATKINKLSRHAEVVRHVPSIFAASRQFDCSHRGLYEVRRSNTWRVKAAGKRAPEQLTVGHAAVRPKSSTLRTSYTCCG